MTVLHDRGLLDRLGLSFWNARCALILAVLLAVLVVLGCVLFSLPAC